jgi:hypothetical protein
MEPAVALCAVASCLLSAHSLQLLFHMMRDSAGQPKRLAESDHTQTHSARLQAGLKAVSLSSTSAWRVSGAPPVRACSPRSPGAFVLADVLARVEWQMRSIPSTSDEAPSSTA